MHENDFNLNEAIDQWRSGLYQTDKFTCEQLDELECHLRDEYASLNDLSISDSEKFLLAGHRLGSIKELEKAYTRSRLLSFSRWSLLGQVALVVITFLQLNQLGNGLLVLLSTQYELADGVLFSGFIGQQIVWLILCGLLLKKLLKMSKQEHKVVQSNIIIISVSVLSLLLLLATAYFSPLSMNVAMPSPLAVYILPNMVYLVLFVTFIIATFRARKKMRLRVGAI